MKERPEVLVVVGTRPEAIKLAPVYLALSRQGGTTRPTLLLTGQHRELLHRALATFDLPVDEDLAIMTEGQGLHDVAVRCLEGLRDALHRRRPDFVLVQGDTASVFFGTLASWFDRIPVGHVEAGLRSHDLDSPFPEEGFRRLTGVLADLHFAPTARARANLLAEGVDPARVHLTGNTVVDALLHLSGRGQGPTSPVLGGLLAGQDPYVLLTAHRRESFGEPLEGAFAAIRTLVEETPGLRLLYPVHPNPRVREPAHRILGGHSRIHLTEPIEYEDLVLALRGASLVLTDSGGIQEEAPTFGVPLLVLREVTERPEGIEAGVAELVGTDPGRILLRAREILARPSSPEARHDPSGNPYGDGRAALRIAQAVESRLGVPSGDPSPPAFEPGRPNTYGR